MERDEKFRIEVARALGGAKVVAALYGVTIDDVQNWRRRYVTGRERVITYTQYIAEMKAKRDK